MKHWIEWLNNSIIDSIFDPSNSCLASSVSSLISTKKKLLLWNRFMYPSINRYIDTMPYNNEIKYWNTTITVHHLKKIMFHFVLISLFLFVPNEPFYLHFYLKQFPFPIAQCPMSRPLIIYWIKLKFNSSFYYYLWLLLIFTSFSLRVHPFGPNIHWPIGKQFRLKII